MKPNQKKPLLPEYTNPMNETAEAFNIRLFKSGGVPEDHDLKVTLRGISKIDEKISRVNEVRGKIMDDRTLNDEAKRAEFLKFVNRMEEQIATDIQNVSMVIDRRSLELSNKINQPIKDEASSQDAHEIRQWFNRNVSEQSEKIAWIEGKIKEKDWEVVSALLGKKSFMSNLKEENKQSLINEYRKKRFSDEFAVTEAFEQVGASVLKKQALLSKFKGSIATKDTVSYLEAQKARQEAMK